MDALHICRAFFGLLYGHILNELQELLAHPEEIEDLLGSACAGCRPVSSPGFAA